MPTECDQPHIMPLAQIILDAVQPYARQHSLSLAAVMSAIGIASGGMLARAYSDPAMVDDVAGRLSIAAREFAKIMQMVAAQEHRSQTTQ
jgi:hypothetical protein